MFLEVASWFFAGDKRESKLKSLQQNLLFLRSAQKVPSPREKTGSAVGKKLFYLGWWDTEDPKLLAEEALLISVPSEQS